MSQGGNLHYRNGPVGLQASVSQCQPTTKAVTGRNRFDVLGYDCYITYLDC